MERLVPGISDIIKGYTINENGDTVNTVSYQERIARGLAARQALADYDAARKANDTQAMALAKAELDKNYEFFGNSNYKDVANCSGGWP